MSEGYKQKIKDEELRKLETALAAFVDTHPAGNPGINQEVKTAEASIRRAIAGVSDPGCGIVGAAEALLESIRASKQNRMSFRKPYQPE